MKSDRARYEDREEVTCRTCGKALRYPSPMVDDANLGVHHPSCRVRRPIRCDATSRENTEDTRSVCGAAASFWDGVKDRCYCKTHRMGLPGLISILKMPKSVVDATLARQIVELG